MSATSDILANCSAEETDGLLALVHAIEYGLDISVYPRQVLICDAPNAVELSFVHGLPGSSGLAPVTYAQDKRMRRSMMERAGVPVPKGATFTIGRGVERAKEFAGQIGFPVTVKPAVGDNGINTFLDIMSVPDMDAALEELKIPPEERAGFTRAAYGLTELREPGIEDGRVIVPPGYMFMVEKQPLGDYLRFLVSDDTVLSVIRCEGAPVDASLSGGQEILEMTHPQVLDLARKAARVIPGLNVVAIDMVVADPTQPLSDGDAYVVEYSERPGLWVQALVDTDSAIDNSEEIFTTYADSKSAELRDPVENAELSFEAFAIPDAKAGAEAMAVAAKRRGLTFELGDIDPVEGVVSGKLSGVSIAVAEFVNALVEGKVADAPVMLMKLHPTV